MNNKRFKLGGIVSSGKSQAIGKRVKFLNNDIAYIGQDGSFNLKNHTGTIVDWDWTYFQDTLFIQLDNGVDLLDNWNNVLQLDLNHHRNTKVYLYKRPYAIQSRYQY